MEFRLLGPVQITVGARVLAVSSEQQRSLLAVLLLNANRVVATEHLIRTLWPTNAPKTARNTVQVHLSRLRRLLAANGGSDRLRSRDPGYVLRVAPGELDVDEFRRLADTGRELLAADDAERAGHLLRQALGLWRGPALANVRSVGLRGSAVRLEDRRIAVFEDRVEAYLRLERYAELLEEIADVAAANPQRERLHAQWMLALYRSGRRADALAVYRDIRAVLRDEHGLDPGPLLQDLHQAILADATRLRSSGPDGTARRTAVVPAQLPADVPLLAGRDVQMAGLDALINDDSAGAVVITAIAGTAGVGKTALAVHWAHRIAGRFADGQLFLNLRGHAPGAPVRPLDALAYLVRSLGFEPGRVPDGVDEAGALYRSLLAGKRVLVVLDDAVSAGQVRPLLPGTSGCVVVITSRNRLSGLVARDGIHRVTLNVLSRSDSRVLLTNMIGRERVLAEPGAAEDLVQLCARLPLALRITSANLANQPARTLAGYVGELAEGDRLGRLEVEGDPQVAVRAAFDLSYRALTPPGRRMFRCLGLLLGPDFTLPATAALIGESAETAARLLDELAAAHLIEPHLLGRYRFHDLLRNYAAERAGAEDSEMRRGETVRQLLDWYLHTADAADRLLVTTRFRLQLEPPCADVRPLTFTDRHQALNWCAVEQPNLIACVRMAEEFGVHDLAWRLPAILSGTMALLSTNRPWADWMACNRIALAAARRLGDRYAEAVSLTGLAATYRGLRRFAMAADHYRQALALSSEIGDHWLQGYCHYGLGEISRGLRQFPAAIGHYERALRSSEEIGDRWAHALALTSLGHIHRAEQRFADASDTYLRALALNQEVGDRWLEGLIRYGLGETCRELHQFDQAIGHYRQALTVNRDIGDRWVQGYPLYGIGEALRRLGRIPEALDHHEQALTICREVGNRRCEAATLIHLGSAQCDADQPRAAVQSWTEALRIYEDLGDPRAIDTRNRLALCGKAPGDVFQYPDTQE